MNLKKNNGNAFMISIFFIAITLALFFFLAIIYVSQMNSLAYNIKLDMYSINKSAIVSVNKGITSRDKFSYNLKTYRNYFEDTLKKNYKLDENLKNDTGLIEQVEILQYGINKKGSIDYYTGKLNSANTIHSVIRVKMKPIFNIDVLKEACTFEIHEDVALNEVVI